jgi:TonB family protein
VFTQLLASRPAKQRSTMGLVTSVVLHLSIVGGVLYATIRPQVVAAKEPPSKLIYIDPTPEPLPPVQRPIAPPVEGSAGAPIFSVPVIIPNALPEIPVGPLPPPTEFTPGTRFIPGGTPSTGGITAPPPGAAYFAEQVDVVVSIAKGSPVPAYPTALRPMGIDGSARFRFIVDSTGRVEVSSVEKVQATHEAFAIAVRNTLGRMRFTPAQVNGKAVRQLVELPFVFRVER